MSMLKVDLGRYHPNSLTTPSSITSNSIRDFLIPEHPLSHPLVVPHLHRPRPGPHMHNMTGRQQSKKLPTSTLTRLKKPKVPLNGYWSPSLCTPTPPAGSVPSN